MNFTKRWQKIIFWIIVSVLAVFASLEILGSMGEYGPALSLSSTLAFFILTLYSIRCIIVDLFEKKFLMFLIVILVAIVITFASLSITQKIPEHGFLVVIYSKVYIVKGWPIGMKRIGGNALPSYNPGSGEIVFNFLFWWLALNAIVHLIFVVWKRKTTTP